MQRKRTATWGTHVSSRLATSLGAGDSSPARPSCSRIRLDVGPVISAIIYKCVETAPKGGPRFQRRFEERFQPNVDGSWHAQDSLFLRSVMTIPHRSMRLLILPRSYSSALS